MKRSLAKEILDDPALGSDTRRAMHASVDALTRLLMIRRWVIGRLRNLGVESVVDLGCGSGALAGRIRDELRIDVTGVDLEPPPQGPIPIVQADAVRDPLPPADAAIAVLLAHHLSDDELKDLIRNAARNFNSLLIVDPVRHWLPAVLFPVVAWPWMHPLALADGRQSIRRSHTAEEFRALGEAGAAATGGRCVHWIAPPFAWQTLEISWSTPAKALEGTFGGTAVSEYR